MRLALLLLLVVPAFAQIEIRYSRQSEEVVKAIVGAVPKTVFVYRADVVNTGTAEARFFPSRVGFEAAVTAPMQDPEAALYAAQHFRETRWWAVALKAGATLAPYGGAALLGLQAFGIQIPDSATTITAGLNGGTALFNSLHKEVTTLNVPATWLRDGLPEVILRPGEPVPYLLALGGNPPLGFVAKVVAQATIKESLTVPPAAPLGIGCMPINGGACADGSVIVTLTTTHPQIDDPVIYDTARIAEMIQERSAARGAVE
jgi:hypothetical protein